MPGRITAIALCTALLAGCGNGDGEGEGDDGSARTPASSQPAAASPTSRPAPTGPPMTREMIYQEALRAFASMSAAASPLDRRRLMAEAAVKVPGWYAHLGLAPPDTRNPQWLTHVVWDTMSEAEYQQTLEQSRALFESHGKPFPLNVTRRQFRKALEDLPKVERESNVPQ